MGQTLRTLAKKDLKKNKVFDKRFVVELCELIHIHYRNLRIVLDLKDWKELARGCADSLRRWFNMDSPALGRKHIELCRKAINEEQVKETMMINLNRNLYKKYADKVFADGNRLEEDNYIHFKYRNLRLELTVEEFKEMAELFADASSTLERVYDEENSCIGSGV